MGLHACSRPRCIRRGAKRTRGTSGERAPRYRSILRMLRRQETRQLLRANPRRSGRGRLGSTSAARARQTATPHASAPCPSAAFACLPPTRTPPASRTQLVAPAIALALAGTPPADTFRHYSTNMCPVGGCVLAYPGPKVHRGRRRAPSRQTRRATHSPAQRRGRRRPPRAARHRGRQARSRYRRPRPCSCSSPS